MPDISSLSSPATYHLLSYGTLLGGQLFHSFVGGIVAFRALSRPQFSVLQQAIFPVYFGMQTALPLVLAFTYIGEKDALGGRPGASVSALFAERNRGTALLPLATVFVAGLTNLVVIEPLVVRIMRERKHQETRDGKRYYDSGPHSQEMVRLNKAFGRMHGLSSLLNMAAILATMWYGMALSERL